MARNEYIHFDIKPRPDLEVMLEQAALTALNDRNWPLTAALSDALAALQTDREQKWADAGTGIPCPRPAAHMPAEHTKAWPPAPDDDFRQWFAAIMHRLSTDAPGARLDIRRRLVVHDFEPMPGQTGPVSDTTPCRHCGQRRTADVHLDPIQ